MMAASKAGSPESPTDIVVTTHNRLDYLERTLEHIYERTRTPYRLHVIDDRSNAGNTSYLWRQWQTGRVHHLLLRGEQCGVAANLNAGAWTSFSDPVVFVDDDVLCPDLNPDWLTRGLAAMRRRQNLALLALRHPGAKVKPIKRDGEVTYCKSVGGTFLFIRRAFLEQHPLPHERGNLEWPLEPRCAMARKAGWDVGVLTEVFCYHIGEQSALTGESYKGKFVPVVDWETLEPTKRYF